MPQVLRDLTIVELSLVDKPCNAERVNGVKIPRARVVLYKRDDSEEQAAALAETGRQTETQRTKEKTEMIETILKSATSREVVFNALEQQAAAIAKRDGITPAAAFAKALRDNPAAYSRYEELPAAAPRRPAAAAPVSPSPFMRQLQTRAADIAKRDGCTPEAAFGKAMIENPALYEQYETERQAEVKKAEAAAEPTEEENCPSCSREVDSGDSFCRNCGDAIGRPAKRALRKPAA